MFTWWALTNYTISPASYPTPCKAQRPTFSSFKEVYSSTLIAQILKERALRLVMKFQAHFLVSQRLLMDQNERKAFSGTSQFCIQFNESDWCLGEWRRPHEIFWCVHDSRVWKAQKAFRALFHESLGVEVHLQHQESWALHFEMSCPLTPSSPPPTLPS